MSNNVNENTRLYSGESTTAADTGQSVDTDFILRANLKNNEYVHRPGIYC